MSKKKAINILILDDGPKFRNKCITAKLTCYLKDKDFIQNFVLTALYGNGNNKKIKHSIDKTAYMNHNYLFLSK